MEKAVLIVEDDEKLRKALSFEFQINGWQVREAPNVSEAIQDFEKSPSHIIVSDIRMPGQSGFYLLQHIKKNSPKTPFVLITGFSDLGWEEIYDAGAEAFFAKPFKVSILVEKAKDLTLSLRDRFVESQKRPIKANGHQSLSGKFPSLLEAAQSGRLKLGRGGFFYALDEKFPLEDELVKFTFEFEHGSVLKMEGFGKVKWTRCVPTSDMAPSGVGIEIVQLKELDDPFFRELESLNTAAFIPRS